MHHHFKAVLSIAILGLGSSICAAQGLRVIIGNDGAMTGTYQ